MNLVFDIGNTRIKAALYNAETCIKTFQTATHNPEIEALNDFFSNKSIHKIAIASVVPLATQRIETALQHIAPIYHFNGLSASPLVMRYQNSLTLGADRLAGALGAFYGYPQAQALVVIDAGTAVNVEVVFENAYCGGAILPGLGLYQACLAKGTAQLPPIDFVLPQTAIGTHTVAALQSGIVHGFLGSLQGILSAICAELSVTPTIIATGGDGAFISQHIAAIHHFAPNLVLDGLARWLLEQSL
jgi:type III pantothenate kinase